MFNNPQSHVFNSFISPSNAGTQESFYKKLMIWRAWSMHLVITEKELWKWGAPAVSKLCLWGIMILEHVFSPNEPPVKALIPYNSYTICMCNKSLDELTYLNDLDSSGSVTCTAGPLNLQHHHLGIWYKWKLLNPNPDLLSQFPAICFWWNLTLGPLLLVIPMLIKIKDVIVFFRQSGKNSACH